MCMHAHAHARDILSSFLATSLSSIKERGRGEGERTLGRTNQAGRGERREQISRVQGFSPTSA